MGFWTIVWDAHAAQLFLDLIKVRRVNFKGKVEITRIGLGRVSRSHLEKVKSEVAHLHQGMLGAFSRFILLIEAAASADLSVE